MQCLITENLITAIHGDIQYAQKELKKDENMSLKEGFFKSDKQW